MYDLIWKQLLFVFFLVYFKFALCLQWERNLYASIDIKTFVQYTKLGIRNLVLYTTLSTKILKLFMCVVLEFFKVLLYFSELFCFCEKTALDQNSAAKIPLYFRSVFVLFLQEKFIVKQIVSKMYQIWRRNTMLVCSAHTENVDILPLRINIWLIKEFEKGITLTPDIHKWDLHFFHIQLWNYKIILFMFLHVRTMSKVCRFLNWLMERVKKLWDFSFNFMSSLLT